MNENCIINVATGIYVNGQDRLKASLQKIDFKGDFLFWTDELPKASLPHDESPMGYKTCAFKIAQQKGYKNILWLDANMICIRNINTIFNKIKKNGYFIYSAGIQNFGEWCSDSGLQIFGISRERSFEIQEIVSSCIGLNMQNTTAQKFLNDWYNYAMDGKTFRGIPHTFPLSRTNDNIDKQVSEDPRVKGHRHDQTAASFLAWKYKMKPSMCELLNYQSTDEFGKHIYSKAIPFDTLILQNRDTKTNTYLESVDKYGNRKGFALIKFLVLSLALTLLRKFRYYNMLKKWY